MQNAFFVVIQLLPLHRFLVYVPILDCSRESASCFSRALEFLKGHQEAVPAKPQRSDFLVVVFSSEIIIADEQWELCLGAP